MKRNEYGAIQQHLEADHVADILVPVPDDWRKCQGIISATREYIQAKEAVESANCKLENSVTSVIERIHSTAGQNG
jgi:Flp pilus assembly CpaF family ATPase